jgi:hypothetical protein
MLSCLLGTAPRSIRTPLLATKDMVVVVSKLSETTIGQEQDTSGRRKFHAAKETQLTPEPPPETLMAQGSKVFL